MLFLSGRLIPTYSIKKRGLDLSFDPESKVHLFHSQLSVIARALRNAGEPLAVREGFLEDLEAWLVNNGDTLNKLAFLTAANLWVLLQPPHTPQALAEFLLSVPYERWPLFEGMRFPEDQEAIAAGLSCEDRTILFRVRLSQMPGSHRLAWLHEVAQSSPELLHPDQGLSDEEVRQVARQKYVPLEDWPAVMRDQVWRATRADEWTMRDGRFEGSEMRYDVPGWFARIEKTPPHDQQYDLIDSLRALLSVASIEEISAFLPGMRLERNMLTNLHNLSSAWPLAKRDVLEQLLSDTVNEKTKTSTLHNMLKSGSSLSTRVYQRLSPTQGLAVVARRDLADVPKDLALRWVLDGKLKADTVKGFLHLVVRHGLYDQAGHRFAESRIPAPAIREAGINLKLATCKPLLYQCAASCLEGLAKGDPRVWENWHFIAAQNPKSEVWSALDQQFPGMLAMMIDQHGRLIDDSLRYTLQILEYTPEMGFLAVLADVAVPGDAMARYRSACQAAPDADRLQLFRDVLLDGLSQEMRGVEMIAPQISPQEKAALWASMVERVRQAAVEISPATSRCASAL